MVALDYVENFAIFKSWAARTPLAKWRIAGVYRVVKSGAGYRMDHPDDPVLRPTHPTALAALRAHARSMEGFDAREVDRRVLANRYGRRGSIEKAGLIPAENEMTAWEARMLLATRRDDVTFVLRFAQVKDAHINEEGDVWINDPCTGHWLPDERLVELAKWAMGRR